MNGSAEKGDLLQDSTPQNNSDVHRTFCVPFAQSGLHPMQGALTNKQVAERLQLRRRLPRHEVPLLEVLGHKALTRLRSRPSARYIPEPGTQAVLVMTNTVNSS